MSEGKHISVEARFESQLEQAYQARMHSIDESFVALHAILKMAKAARLVRIVARTHTYLGLLYMIQGNYSKSIFYSQNALKYFLRVNSLKDIADAKFNIASSLYKTDNFHEGLKGLLECRQIYKSIHDLSSEARTLKAVATIYEYWGDMDKAFSIYEECIALATANGDLAMLSNVYNPLSGLYIKRGDLETATLLSNKSIAIKKKIRDERGLAYSVYGKGKLYMVQGKYGLAERHFLQSLDLMQTFADKLGEGMVLNKLGLNYICKKDFLKAEKTLKEALVLSEKNNIKVILFKSYYNLYLLYKAQDKATQALHCLEKFVAYKENTVHSRTSDIIKSYEAANEIYRLEKDTKAQHDYLEIVQKKNTELDSFFYRVSHDLKGPIASLLGLNTLIEMEQFDAAAMKYFAMYKKLSMRIDAIVMDLINITRISSDKIVPTKIDFNTLIEDCINSYAYFDNFDRIEFKVSVEKRIRFKSEWVIVNTILQNLIENAIKYMREDAKRPYIAVRVYKKEDRLCLEVKDNGQGIPEEYQGRIFDMFFRANEKADGSGLGLYILKRAVERLQGQVTMKSTLGKGSVFTVSIKESGL